VPAAGSKNGKEGRSIVGLLKSWKGGKKDLQRRPESGEGETEQATDVGLSRAAVVGNSTKGGKWGWGEKKGGGSLGGDEKTEGKVTRKS